MKNSLEILDKILFIISPYYQKTDIVLLQMLIVMYIIK